MTGAREVAARDLSFDVCVRENQLPDIARLAGAIPELRLVLDHLGKPAVGTAASPIAPSAEWARDLTELARHANAFCKLSGLPGEAGGDWSAEQLEPFLDVAADAFGVERLMWERLARLRDRPGRGWRPACAGRWVCDLPGDGAIALGRHRDRLGAIAWA